MINLFVLFNQLKYAIAVERMTFKNFEQQTSVMKSVPPSETVCFFNLLLMDNSRFWKRLNFSLGFESFYCSLHKKITLVSAGLCLYQIIPHQYGLESLPDSLKSHLKAQRLKSFEFHVVWSWEKIKQDA